MARMDAIVSGDIGCYTLGALPPLDAMDACMNMGASIGMAHGMEKVLPESQRKKLVSVIGDSTFYHSGVTGLMDVVYNRGSGTVVVLDNRTTAMTGHQAHPGTGTRLDDGTRRGSTSAASPGRWGWRTCGSWTPTTCWAPGARWTTPTRADHPAVLIAEKPCVLQERISFGEPVVLDAEKCTDCFACTRLGCPAIEETGGRLQVNDLLCNGCTHCQQVCGNCNAGIDIPLVLELVDQGRVAEAFDVLTRANPMPGVASHVCPHPCEHDVNALGFPQAEVYAARTPSS
jgi:indolepyruvate ferredoxin oxidoreductase, alpha subunit